MKTRRSCRGTKFEPPPLNTQLSHQNTTPNTTAAIPAFSSYFSRRKNAVQYTKVWVMWLKENGVVDSWKHAMKRTASLRK
jgi:hypothetical protein